MIKRIKLRSLFIGGCITLFFLVLVGRVFWIQVLQGDFWQKRAADTWAHTTIIRAQRGQITDRNGSMLASDVPAYTVVVEPDVIQEQGIRDEVVEGLHGILNKPVSELEELIDAKDKDGNLYKNREVRNEGWKVDQEVADKITEFAKKLEKEHDIRETGVGWVKDQKRYYPKDSLAAHVLGYTDRDGKAVAGLEYFYDKLLKGTDGYLDYQSDGKGVKLPDAAETYKPVVNGDKLRLTIDSTIQYYIEDAMKEAYDEYQPKSMTVIAADPNTMEILGMANLPTFNPNEYWKTQDQGDFYNHAIKSIYEPGSTFKIVTLAGTVQEKLFDPNAKFQSGQIRIKGYSRPLHDIKRAGWGQITYLEGVKRSSNVAFVKLGYEMLGQDKLKQYIDNFGFDEKTGIDLPGEVKGRITPEWPVEFATLAYGHGKVQVTPIQQLAAVSAVANGGKLLKPHMVKEIADPNTGKVTVTKPEVVRQVISAETAKKTGSYLEQVVADQEIGTGRHAYIEGYRVAGKTGTAIKVEGQNYDNSKVLVSFIGYAPVNDPKIAVIVIIDEPNAEVGGGTAAAPVFKKIVSQSLEYMGVPKVYTEKDKKAGKAQTAAASVRKTPNLVGQNMKSAKEELIDQGFDFESVGGGPSVVSQYPAAGTALSSGQKVYLLSEQGDKPTIPDLRGESLRDALEVLTLLKVGIQVDGEGYVSKQQESVNNGKTKVSLTLKPDEQMGEESDTASAEAGDPSTQPTSELTSELTSDLNTGENAASSN
ncbi:penicillin-binding transpeptidase domain-containing protein [Paenibacillus sp. URB8-2]|uniref:penicillin-binding transpeptidase domain-containing protein n=1 Tax=Paenibacillus sp. URB8-2 TaxID=2741301 RepID=UPI0015B8D5CB|nr:penicillin-binding transpeptidase domain-containing protein [Paenibacillus sp. URB8-2]BCG60244.1 penicillin-binding protein 2B [Paenibacillus sp. URB8-2]